jgi:hypothetical protein
MAQVFASGQSLELKLLNALAQAGVCGPWFSEQWARAA